MLALEDDVVAAEGWDAKIMNLVRELEAKDDRYASICVCSMTTLTAAFRWLSVKLYYPANWGRTDVPILIVLSGHAALLYCTMMRVQWYTGKWCTCGARRGHTLEASDVRHWILLLWCLAIGFVCLRSSSKQLVFPQPKVCV